MPKLSNKLIRMLAEAFSLATTNRLKEAQSIYLRLLKQIPGNLDVINNLGVIEAKIGNAEDAKGLFEKSLLLDRKQPLILSYLANIYNQLNENKKAMELFEESLALDSTSPVIYFNQGKVFSALGLYEKAIAAYRIAIKIDPAYIKAHNNLGFIFNKMGDYRDAIAAYTHCLDLDPRNAIYFFNRGIAFENSRYFSKAMDDYNSSLSIEPENPKVNFNKGVLNLLLGNMKEGWLGYEHRPKTDKINSYCRNLSKPTLPYFNLENKKIVLFSDQGLGEQILFSSILIDAEKTKNQFIIIVDKRLIGLLERSFNEFKSLQFVSYEQKIPLDSCDYYFILAELAIFFRPSYQHFEKQKKGYLIADRLKALSLRSRKIGIKKSEFLCGISWKSTKTEASDEKSLGLAEFIPFLSLTNIRFVNLQYGDCENEINELMHQHGIKLESVREIDNYNDIDGLASLIEACDFVITSSNVTAHIAGAINKKTFLLVPYHFGASWHWHLDDIYSRWYPSIKIFRQTTNKSWQEPVSRIAKELNIIYGS